MITISELKKQIRKGERRLKRNNVRPTVKESRINELNKKKEQLRELEEKHREFVAKNKAMAQDLFKSISNMDLYKQIEAIREAVKNKELKHYLLTSGEWVELCKKYEELEEKGKIMVRDFLKSISSLEFDKQIEAVKDFMKNKEIKEIVLKCPEWVEWAQKYQKFN